MTEPKSTNLLWVNKDATNLHSKKHVAEVNAHVQRRGSRNSTSERTSRSDSVSSLRRADKIRRRSSQTPPVTKCGDSADQQVVPASDVESQLGSSQHSDEVDRSMNPREYTAQYSTDLVDYDERSLSIIAQMAYVEDHVVNPNPETFDIANPLPGLISGLSNHDQMLVHTYLTYLPQALFGLHHHPTYCPIRSASVINMTRDPLGLLWVLISLDMFLAKAQARNDYDAYILQRKNQAYQLMAMRLGNSQETHSMGFIIGTGSAALAELFFGDPKKGMMHLSAVETVLQSKGGTLAIASLPQTVTIPLMSAFAYRTMFRNGLSSIDQFSAAHSKFMGTLRLLLGYNEDCNKTGSNRQSPHGTIQEEEVTPGSESSTESHSTLARTKRRIFARGSLMHKFVQSNPEYIKPTDQIDHFVILYSLNIALLDLGQQHRYTSRFLEEVAEDINTAGSTGDVDSSLKMSGARCVVVSRHAQTFAYDRSEGVARAWGAIDALDILKHVSMESKSKIFSTLSAFLTSEFEEMMDYQEIDAIDAEASVGWWQAFGTDDS